MSQPLLVDLKSYRDGRGALSVVDSWDQLPFRPARIFWVSGVPAGIQRGGHASLVGHELLVCVAGVCTVETESSDGCETFELGRADQGLYLPPMVWMTYRHDSPAAAVVVLASNHYDPGDMLTDHAKFVARIGRTR